MNKKIMMGLLVMIVLLPFALAYSVVVDCPKSVAPNSAFTCGLSLKDVGTATVQTFQFKLSYPSGVTAGNPLVIQPNGVLTWKGLDKNAVVFSMASLTDGEFAKINLVSGTTSGDIDLTSKVPEFTSTKATILVGEVSTCTKDLDCGQLTTSALCTENGSCTTIKTPVCQAGKCAVQDTVSCAKCADGKICQNGNCVNSTPTCIPACTGNSYCFQNKDHSNGALCVCKDGFMSCDNSCETNVKTDSNNCGSCENACTDTQTCVEGVCEDEVETPDDESGMFDKITQYLAALRAQVIKEKGADATPTVMQKLTAIARAIKESNPFHQNT